MITNVSKSDAAEIAAIYNYYIRESVATFDTEEWQTEKMAQRIETLSASYPYIVYRKRFPHHIHISFTELKMGKLPVSAMHIHGKKKMPIN